MLKTIFIKNDLTRLHSSKLKEAYSLAILSFFSLALFALRVQLSGSFFFMFLIWNLFLAFIPWAISSVLILSGRVRNLKLIAVPFLLSWVLFFPNAPYILTDLFHLQHRRDMPTWFDLVLILTFAWTGLLYGFCSLRDIAFLCKKKLSSKVVNPMIAGFLFLSSFGIYIGRYLRWNSWDIISRPSVLISDIWDIIIHPVAHPKAWGMTLLMGFMLNIIYWTFRPLKQHNV